MEEVRYVRLRTTVVVVSMLVLPAAAVFGVKMPAESLASKRPEAATTGTNAKPPAEQLARNGQTTPTPGLFPKSGEQATSKSTQYESTQRDIVQAGGETNAAAPNAGPAVATASANIDVPGRSAEASLDGASPSQIPLAFASQADVSPSAPSAPYDGATLANAEVLHPTAPAPTATASPGGGLEQFTQIQQRLRALGATHYALETWGTDGQLYRFQCRMAAGHTSDYTRQFEATDTDALRTMVTVLEEVEAWKAGRLP